MAAPDDTVTVRFLGTGGPEITVERQGIATLIEAGGESYLFDTGRGVLQRLYETGVNPKRIASSIRICTTITSKDCRTCG